MHPWRKQKYICVCSFLFCGLFVAFVIVGLRHDRRSEEYKGLLHFYCNFSSSLSFRFPRQSKRFYKHTTTNKHAHIYKNIHIYKKNTVTCVNTSNFAFIIKMKVTRQISYAHTHTDTVTVTYAYQLTTKAKRKTMEQCSCCWQHEINPKYSVSVKKGIASLKHTNFCIFLLLLCIFAFLLLLSPWFLLAVWTHTHIHAGFLHYLDWK